MLKNMPVRTDRQSGFSLVELMVAMVLGLIVIGAVIALVLSMMRANNQTIAATRLTQELRAVAALMSGDLRRAGGVIDPLTVATAATGNPFAAIDTATAGCILYSYENAEGGNFHAINFRNGAVFLDAGDTVRNCTGGTRLSSQQVFISGLTFARQGPCGTPSASGRCINMILRGCLSNRERTGCDPANPISRSYSQDVYIRSLSGA